MKTEKKTELIKAEENTVSKIAKNKVIIENTDFPIVGIGSSAGGLETLELFF